MPIQLYYYCSCKAIEGYKSACKRYLVAEETDLVKDADGVVSLSRITACEVRLAVEVFHFKECSTDSLKLDACRHTIRTIMADTIFKFDEQSTFGPLMAEVRKCLEVNGKKQPAIKKEVEGEPAKKKGRGA